MQGGSTEAPVLVHHEPYMIDGHQVHNPARTSEVVGVYGNARADLVDKAIRSAADAQPGWAETPAEERAAALRKAAEALGPELDAWSELLSREHGKLRREAARDVGSGPKILSYYADLAEKLVTPEVVEDARGTIVTRRRPVGVTGIIVPWNAPVLLGFLMAAPPLLAGNAIVVKPSELAPLTVTQVLSTVSRVLPPGVLNVVPAFGPEAGQVLTTHPAVRRVIFTGSTAIGRTVMAQAAATIKNVTLELGGNDPAIVLDDAEIDERLIDGLKRGTFEQAGQTCMTVKRIYVHRSKLGSFLDAFYEAVDGIVVGEGLDDRSSMGPVNSAGQRARIENLVKSAEEAGGDVRRLGSKVEPDHWDDGHYLLPAVATNLDASHPLVAEEQFGPVVPVIPFEDLDEVFRAANDTEYGLNASIWTSDPERGFALSDRLEAGTVFVNVHRGGASDVSMPFGGFKQSGLGRTHGWVAVEEATELQVVAHRTDS